MTQHEAFNSITVALRKVLKRDDIQITRETDLAEKKVLDSLDRIVFLMELSELTGRDFPEEIDLVKTGILKVNNLIDFLTGEKTLADFADVKS
jgi:acyl carrier protein